MSQAHQDAFVLNVNGYKRNGTFVEIGSNHPIEHNNSYILESSYNWRGLLVEYDKSFGPLYDLHRPKSIYRMQDARTVPYREILDTHKFPDNIGYLQIDLDVNNKSTLDTLIVLNNTVFDKYKFASVTFEHDIYTGNYFDTQKISRKIFNDRGMSWYFQMYLYCGKVVTNHLRTGTCIPIWLIWNISIKYEDILRPIVMRYLGH